MKKEFIPYEQALAIKELGFAEPCLARYIPTSQKLSSDDSTWGEFYPESAMIPAPLYQQVFRWFREKGWSNTISSNYENGVYCFEVWKEKQFMFETDCIYATYEEAELECLKKLIEIVKNK